MLIVFFFNLGFEFNNTQVLFPVETIRNEDPKPVTLVKPAIQPAFQSRLQPVVTPVVSDTDIKVSLKPIKNRKLRNRTDDDAVSIKSTLSSSSSAMRMTQRSKSSIGLSSQNISTINQTQKALSERNSSSSLNTAITSRTSLTTVRENDTPFKSKHVFSNANVSTARTSMDMSLISRRSVEPKGGASTDKNKINNLIRNRHQPVIAPLAPMLELSSWQQRQMNRNNVTIVPSGRHNLPVPKTSKPSASGEDGIHGRKLSLSDDDDDDLLVFNGSPPRASVFDQRSYRPSSLYNVPSSPASAYGVPMALPIPQMYSPPTMYGSLPMSSPMYQMGGIDYQQYQQFQHQQMLIQQQQQQQYQMMMNSRK